MIDLKGSASTFNGWRVQLAFLLLALASIPLKIYAVPGFEITPSLVLAPVALVLFDPRERVDYAVAAFLLFCALLALVGPTGHEGRFRNLLGAASYSSGAPYLLVGLTLGRSRLDLTRLWRALAPAAVVVAGCLAIDLFLTRGNLVQSAAYSSVAYTSNETVFVQSAFPFYGKFAVITLATVIMVLGGLALGSAPSFRNRYLGVLVLLASAALLFMAFSMWSRQVMAGVVIFYLLLALLAYRRRETWVALAVFLALLIPWSYAVQQAPDQIVGAEKIGQSKVTRGLEDLRSGDNSDLSTGRLPLYRTAIERISPRVLLGGCGFCDLKDVPRFAYSSLHNVVLTAIFKGGAAYAVIYLGTAFYSLILLWFVEKSFARDVSIAVVASVGAQSMVNDVIYFQVIPALLFALTGFLVGSRSSAARAAEPRSRATSVGA